MSGNPKSNGHVADWRDRAIGFALALAYAAVLLFAQRDTGFARDEGYYFDAGRRYASWVEKAFSSPREAFTKKAIDRAFDYNHEHPGLLKTLFGLSEGLFHDRLGWLSSSAALRLPGILISALALALLYRLGRTHSRAAGFAAAFSYATLPRLFFHAQLACFDAAMATLALAVTAAFVRSLESKLAVLGGGVLFGLALSTKLNAFFVPPVLLLWLLLTRRDALKRGIASLAVMGVVGVLVFFALWPWLWTDPISRLRDYLAFHAGHAYYNTEYFGVNYHRPPLPVSFPFVMTALTTPVTTLLLALCGAILTLTRREQRTQRAQHSGAVLYLLSFLTPVVIIALPKVPIFGGTKHWLTAMPFLALFAGFALAALAQSVRPLARAALIGLAIAPGAVSAAHFHPFGLSQYNALAGGAPGAADLGLIRQFWGYPTRPLLPWMNQTFLPNARVYWHDTNHASLVQYQREGLLRRDIRDTGLEWPGVQASTRAIVIHEKHFAKYEHMIWNAYQTASPKRVLAQDGVPLVTVYERPAEPPRP